MALLISNISILKCYRERFTVNSYLPIKKSKSIHQVCFAVCGMYCVTSSSGPSIYLGGDLLLSVQNVADFTERLIHHDINP